MVPALPLPSVQAPSAPRTRGDGPTATRASRIAANCSPHARGWSRGQQHQHVRDHLLPARAGMVPRAPPRCASTVPAPRTRGDGPSERRRTSPYAVCSPHARGWSRRRRAIRRSSRLLPARAGMVPKEHGPSPAPSAAPRTRGDGPTQPSASAKAVACSPHARGWSLRAVRVGAAAELLPARTGMVPSGSRPGFRRCPAPRTRGDGPQITSEQADPFCCSPHARGWSLLEDGDRQPEGLLPARAGMVPAPGRRPRPIVAAPLPPAIMPAAAACLLWAQFGRAGAPQGSAPNRGASTDGTCLSLSWKQDQK